MRRLIVNADDFGLTRGVTEGIVEAHQRGIVTSTSLMACGSAFAHAVRLARENPRLDVGIHLTLVEETPVSGIWPQMPESYADFVRRWMRGFITPEDVRTELRAQILKCLDAGVRPTHLDSHQHLHVLPGILKMVTSLAREFGIRAVRLPRDFPAHWSSRFVQKTALCGLARIVEQPALTTDRMAGLFEAGELSEARLLDILGRLPAGSTELCCHPGHEDQDCRARYAHWHYHWDMELAALTNARTLELVQERGIRLIGYSEL